jgi:hypothetical protein
MASKENEEKVQTTLHRVMDKMNCIGRKVEDKEVHRAHNLRDELFSFVVGEISSNIKVYTKRDIQEMLSLLVSVDEDWGL